MRPVPSGSADALSSDTLVGAMLPMELDASDNQSHGEEVHIDVTSGEDQVPVPNAPIGQLSRMWLLRVGARHHAR